MDESARSAIEQRAARTAKWLLSADPRLTLTQRWEGESSHLQLPQVPGADIAFRLMFDQGAYTLFAVPATDPDVGLFWHQVFEQMGAPSVEEAERDFREFVVDVLSHESRITQRRGLLFHGFACEVLRDAEWERVGGQILVLRTSGRVPRIEQRTKEYRSPAVLRLAG